MKLKVIVTKLIMDRSLYIKLYLFVAKGTDYFLYKIKHDPFWTCFYF